MGRRAVPTHQSLTGSSDEDLLQRMVETHPERFGQEFWTFYTTHIGSHLPPRPVMIDLGCGPGLLLRDLGGRHPGATLYGYDVTPAMIAYGQQLSYGGAEGTPAVPDVAPPPLPPGPRRGDLGALASGLH